MHSVPQRFINLLYWDRGKIPNHKKYADKTNEKHLFVGTYNQIVID